jgi:hypothetical protein
MQIELAEKAIQFFFKILKIRLTSGARGRSVSCNGYIAIIRGFYGFLWGFDVNYFDGFGGAVRRHIVSMGWL